MNDDEKAREREYLFNRVGDLRKMAAGVEGIAYGKIDPHGKEAARLAIYARNIIKYLVEDWL